MGIRFIINISIKQKKKYPYDDVTGVKSKYIIQRGIIYTPGYYPIQKMWDRDLNIDRDNFRRKIKSTGYIYLSG